MDLPVLERSVVLALDCIAIKAVGDKISDPRMLRCFRPRRFFFDRRKDVIASLDGSEVVDVYLRSRNEFSILAQACDARAVLEAPADPLTQIGNRHSMIGRASWTID